MSRVRLVPVRVTRAATSLAVLTAAIVALAPAAPRVHADAGPIVAIDSAGSELVGISDDGTRLLLKEASSQGRLFLAEAGRPTTLETSFRVETAALSGDGRVEVVETTAPVDPGDSGSSTDLYRRVIPGGFARVEVPALAGVARLWIAGVSDDGRYAAVVAHPLSGQTSVQFVDLDTGAASTLTPTVTDFPGTLQATSGAAISDDGRFVAFGAIGSRPGCTNCAALVYRWDRTTGASTLVSRGANGPANGWIGSFAISGDGRTVAIASNAPNLDVPFSGLTPISVFVSEDAGPLRRLATDRLLEIGGTVLLSDDGTIVGFSGRDGPTSPAPWQAFVYDRNCETYADVSQPNDVSQWASGSVSDVRVSGDGTTVAFTSTSTNLTDVQRGGPSPYVTSTPGCPAFIPARPFRVLDTRATGTTFDGIGAGAGLRPAGSVTEIPLRGRNAIAPLASAAIVNITVTETSAPGYLTVYPCDQPRPTASNLNYVAGVDGGNNVIATIGSAGSICVYTYAATHLVADVSGWFIDGGGYVPLSPRRIVETRTGEGSTVDGVTSGIGRLAAGSTLRVPVGGRPGVSTRTGAVVLNVAAVSPLGPGFLTVYPCNAPRPTAASLNFVAARTVSNTVVVGVPATAAAFVGAPVGSVEVCVYSSAATDLVIDLGGTFDAFAAIDATTGLPVFSPLWPVTPARLLDTRPGAPTIDGAFSGQGLRLPNTTLHLKVAGRGGVPAGATAVVLNVVALLDLVGDGHPASYVTAYACDTERPLASSLNYPNHAITGNNVIAPIAADGTICLYAYGAADLVIDVTGALF